MANKGKAPMDPRQEELEERAIEERAIKEQSRLRRERLQLWQDDWAFDGLWHGPSNLPITDASPSVVRPPVGGFLPPSPEYTPASPPKVLIQAPLAPILPERSPDSRAQRHDRLMQRIEQANVDLLWHYIEPPVHPSLGPLYCFREGYYRFRYGTPAEKIIAKEIHYAQKSADEEPSEPSEDGEGRYEEKSVELTLRTLGVSSEDNEDDEVEVEVIPDEEEEAEDEDEVEEDQSSEPQSTITDEPSVM